MIEVPQQLRSISDNVRKATVVRPSEVKLLSVCLATSQDIHPIGKSPKHKRYYTIHSEKGPPRSILSKKIWPSILNMKLVAHASREDLTVPECGPLIRRPDKPQPPTQQGLMPRISLKDVGAQNARGTWSLLKAGPITLLVVFPPGFVEITIGYPKFEWGYRPSYEQVLSDLSLQVVSKPDTPNIRSHSMIYRKYTPKWGFPRIRGT